MNEKLKQKYLAQFDKLIQDGKLVMATGCSDMYGSSVHNQLFCALQIQAVNLLQQVVPRTSPLCAKIEEALSYKADPRHTEIILGTLDGVRADFVSGMFDELAAKIEETVAVDYLQQAKDLLSEKDNINYSHVPAAVLSGVVLEKTIRTLCEKQNPPIGTVKTDGDFKKVMPLVDELVKIGVFGPAKSNQIKAWLAIRNSAAHGKDSEFTQKDVEAMIQGINDFMAKYLV